MHDYTSAEVFQNKSPAAPVRVVIFAKAPLEGFAKTRLIPALGVAGAAALARNMLQHSVTEAVSAYVGPVELCVTPDLDHSIWTELELPSSIVWSEQGGGELGERLARVAERIVSGGESVIFMGTDCPGLDAQVLRDVSGSLSRNNTCLVPVADGGYALLGLNSFHASLFQSIPWSTEKVAEITQERIRALGWSCEVFPALRDIDEPQDLQWLPHHWRETENG